MARTQYHTQGANPCGYPVGSVTHRTRCRGETVEPASSAASNGHAAQPVSLRSLAMQAGVSYKDTQRVMDVVAREGLVTAETEGRSITYSPA